MPLVINIYSQVEFAVVGIYVHEGFDKLTADVNKLAFITKKEWG